MPILHGEVTHFCQTQLFYAKKMQDMELFFGICVINAPFKVKNSAPNKKNKLRRNCCCNAVCYYYSGHISSPPRS